MNENLPKISEVVAVMGLQPTSQNQDEMRFGKKCSLAIHTGEDKFYDHENKIGGGVLDFIVHQDLATDRASAAQWCKSNGLLPHETPAPRTPLRQHVYNDEHGQPVRKAVKYNNGSWSQMRYEGGSWRYGVKGVPDLPYGADRLAQGKSDELVFIFEGEQDCERAWQNGFQATCNVGGAGKWRDGLNATLTGRTVCIVPDNDTAGEDHAHSVKASLQSSGIDCFVLWDYTDDLPHKADFSDWMDANRDNVEQFGSLVKAAQASPQPEQNTGAMKLLTAKQLSALEMPDLSYIIQDILPDVGLTLSAGPPKVGKTWLNWWIAKQAVQAGKRVLFISTEDNNRRMRDRLQQTFHEPPDNLICLAIMSQEAVLPTGPSALTYMQELVNEFKPDVLVIDTISGILTPSASNKNYAITVSEYGALRKFSHKNALALIGTTHTRKKSEVSSAPVETILGSQGIGATAETLLVMEKLEGQKNCRLHVTGKDVPQDDFFLRWTGNGFDLEANTEEAELGPFQKDCLEQIRRKPRITQLGLIHDLGKDQAQVSRAVNRLIEKDLIIKIKEGYTAI